MKHRVVNVTEFKAKCLSMLDELSERGGTITITKRGQPLATVRRADRRPRKSSKGILAGKFRVPDGLEKMDLSHLWEVNQPARGARR